MSDLFEEMNLNKLGREVGDIQEYFTTMQLYRAAIKEIKTKLEILDDEFQVKYDYNPIHHIESRLKEPGRLLDKLKRKGLNVSIDSMRDNIYDVAGIRVICNYISDVERIADFLVKQDDVTLIKRKDYINNPKANGYRSLHVVVSIPIFLYEKIEIVPVEVQIRTIAMDFWASLEHQLRYSAKVDVPDELRLRLTQCAGAIQSIDEEMQEINEEISKLKRKQGSKEVSEKE